MDPDEAENLEDCCKAVRIDATDSVGHPLTRNCPGQLSEYNQLIHTYIHAVTHCLT